MIPIREYITSLGSYGNMTKAACKDIVTGKTNFKETCRQIVIMGINSLPIILLTAVFSGMVLALQTAYGLHRFGAKNYVGNIVGLGLVRELGPVLSAIMLSGRIGAGIAAEIASMVVTEQVDAIKALGASPIRKLVSPRLLAGIIISPLLVICADLIGILGGLFVSVLELHLPSYTFERSLLYTILIQDVLDGLIKSAVFGFLLVSISCWKGLNARGGTEGVGRTTTSAVVTSSMVIFIANFFLTKFLLMIRT